MFNTIKKASSVFVNKRSFSLFLTAAILVSGFFGFSGTALAARTINSVTLNDLSSVVVTPSASITAAVDVSSTDNWKSTKYQIGVQTAICVNTPDHNGTHTESFSITAPSSLGTYDVSFWAYNNDTCSSGESGIRTLANGITVVNAVMVPNKDSHVNQEHPTDTYGSDSNMDVESYLHSGSHQQERSLVNFNLSSYSSHVVVSSAEVYLYLHNAPSSSRTYNIYRVTSSWTEAGVNWDNQPSIAGVTSSSTTGTTDGVWKSWGVTSDVQSFLGTPATTNYGWELRDSSEDSGTDYKGEFYTKEKSGTTYDPYLALTYSCASGWSGTYCDISSDATPPTVTIDSVLPNPTNAGATVTWHANENGTYSVRVGGTNCSNGTSVASGTYSTSPSTVATAISAPNLAEGSNTLRVCVTDAATNTGNASSSVTKDTTVPTVNSLTEVYPGTQIAAKYGDTVHVTADVSDDSGVASVSMMQSGDGLCQNEPLNFANTSGNIWEANCIIGRHDAGVGVNIPLIVTDSLGNSGQSAQPQLIHYDIDNGLPTASVTSPTEGSTVSGTTTTITATASDAEFGIAKVEFWHATPIGIKIGEGILSGGVYSINWDTTDPVVGALDGPHQIWAVAYDNAGNYANSSNVSVTVNNAPPTVTSFNSSTSDGSYNEGKTIDFTVNFDENVIVSGGTPSILLSAGPGRKADYVSGSGSNILNFSYTVGAGDGTPTELANAGAAINLNGATIKDGAGNDANVTLPDKLVFEAAHEIIIDTAAPTVTIDSVTPDPTNAGTTVTWHANENGTYDVRVGGTDCLTGTSVESGSYSTQPSTVASAISASSLAEELNTLRACVTDAATNTGNASPSVTKDTIAPTGGSITYTDGYFATASVPITYTLGTDSGSGLNLSSGKIQRASATLAAGTCGGFSAFSDLVTESDGSYTDASVVSGNCYKYQYLISDNAGNTATYTSGNVAKVDTTVPTASVTSPTAGTHLKGTVTITADAADSTSGVAKVEFWHSTAVVKIGEDTTAPYSIDWDTTLVLDGSHSLWAVAYDNAGNPGSSSWVSIVVDNTAPVLTLPLGGIIAEAIGPDGAVVNYESQVYAIDVIDGPVPAVCAPLSSSMFPLIGTPTTVNCSATDTAGNPATGSFSVTVQDTTPPAIIGSISVTSLGEVGPGGAVVNYTSPTASDLVDGSVPVTCDPVSGSTFPLGITIVTCTATDSHGNSRSEYPSITVVDEDAPVLALPGNITAEATGPSGAVVNYEVSAVDAVDGSVPVTCDPVPGSTFPLGVTTVNCSATDAALNTATGHFDVTVEDTTPPTIDSHDNVTGFAATSPEGAVVDYDSPVSHDLVDGDLAAECSPASGSTFSEGTTLVTCNKTDAHGNAASPVTFNVVVDNAAPVLDEIGDKSFGEETLLTFTTPATDPDGDELTYSATALPEGATFDAATQTFSWTPNEAQGPGEYPFTVEVSDGDLTDSETITITVDEVNLAPVAADVSDTINQNKAKIVTLDASDADVPANILTYAIVGEPAHGTLGDIDPLYHQLIYTPGVNYYGPDSFIYKANDGLVDSNIATVSLEVIAPGGGGVPSGTPLPAPSLTIPSGLVAPIDITPTSVTIFWTTSHPATSQIIYSLDGEPHVLDINAPPTYGYAHTTPEYDIDPKVTSHSVTVLGLTPGTVYYYRTVSHGSLVIGDEGSFATSPTPTPATPAAPLLTPTPTPSEQPTPVQEAVAGAQATPEASVTPEVSATPEVSVTPEVSPVPATEEPASQGFPLAAAVGNFFNLGGRGALPGILLIILVAVLAYFALVVSGKLKLPRRKI